MESTTPAGFTLWLRTAASAAPSATVEEIVLELGRRGLPVEQIDAARMAREAYISRSANKGVSLAIAMTADALNRHGIVCLIHGARTSAWDFSWKKRKPGWLLDIVCADEGETVHGSGPYLTLRPLDATNAGVPPDPPAVARVDEKSDFSEEEPSGQDQSDAHASAISEQNLLRHNISPLFDALEKAGWIPTFAAPTNGDDELLRKRLQDLGYL